MKALPLITLAICAGFLVFQQRSVSSINTSNTTLETRILQAERVDPSSARPGAGPSAATKSSRRKPGPGSGESATLATAQSISEVDLAELVEAMQQAESGGAPDFKAMIRIRSLLLKATPEEITELIARAGELDVSEEMKRGLIAQFVEVLSEHDPRAALELAFKSAHQNPERQRWQFTNSFSKWLSKEPGVAIAWFDQQLAQGAFASKSLSGESDLRREFEAAAIGALVRTDSARAQARLLALPEKDRLQILLQGHRFGLTSEQAPAYAQLVRETLPEEKQRADALGSAAQHLVRRGGYQEVADFADTINASDAERANIVQRAAIRQFERMGWEDRSPKAEDVAELRTFLQAQAPDQANRITGEALASTANSTEKLETAVALVREVHATSPNDEILVGFIERAGALRRENAARELIQEIVDPAQREALLEKLK